jgi:hypothetical protein
MFNKNNKDYKNVVINKLVLGLGQNKDKKISTNFPSVKKSFFSQKKVHYLIPQQGVSILSSPAVIIRLSAMARARKVSYFSV